MRVLKPEIDALNEKFDDPMKKQQAQMDLYKKTISFIKTRVDLDLASFKEDIWSH